MHTAGVLMARGGCGSITGNGVGLGTVATSSWSHRISHSVLRRCSVRAPFDQSWHQLSVPPAPHQLLRLKSGFRCDSDRIGVAVTHTTQSPSSDAPTAGRYRTCGILENVMFTLATEPPPRAPPHWLAARGEGPSSGAGSGEVIRCVYPALFITRATGTLVGTPTDPRRRRGGVIL